MANSLAFPWVAVLAVVLLPITVHSGAAGERRAAPPPPSADPAARAAEIRRRMEAEQDRHIRALLAESPSGERADVALIIGTFFENGRLGDGEPDMIKASEYYRLAAEQGVAEAMCALAILSARGAESPGGRIRRNMAKALDQYERAAAAGSVKAMLDLGIFYTDGDDGVAPDGKKAVAYLVDAASRGDETALARLTPVVNRARDWEASHPGRKANFPTSREELVKPELAQAEVNRGAKLIKLAERVSQNLNRRLVEANRAILSGPDRR